MAANKLKTELRVLPPAFKPKTNQGASIYFNTVVWLDEITRESYLTRGLRHLPQNKFTSVR